MPRPRLAPALGLALAAACSGSSTSPAATASPDAGQTVSVGQNGLPRFVTPGAAAGQENQVTIAPGATVTWRFVTSGYNVVSGGADGGCAADGLFCSPNDLSCATAPPQIAGSFYQHTFQVIGDYPYFSQPCLLPDGGVLGMTGVVHVLATPTDGGVDGGP